MSRTRPFFLEPEPPDLEVRFPYHQSWVDKLVQPTMSDHNTVTVPRHIRIYTDRETGLKFRVDHIHGCIFVHTCANVSTTCHDLDHFAMVYPDTIGTAQVFRDRDSSPNAER